MKNATFLLTLVFAVTLNAQTKTITGTVSDTSGPLPGANVVIKGTTTGTQTDFDGNYQILASEGDVLVFSYIGFKTEEIKVRTGIVINVKMQEDAQALEEVVTIGYGYSTGISYTPSKAQIKREKRNAYHNSIARQLQDKAAGVEIVSTSGAVGASNIKIRGIGSSKKEKTPFYIVDGTPIHKQHNPIIAQLQKEDIDKVNVYEGSKGKKLFGKMAKDGCIVITTKKGNYQLENDENYAQYLENKFERASLNPLSTFSIDVDKAGYSNIRRFINNGQSIPVDAVKIEEMVNYFDYEYAQPSGNHPFSIATDAAVTPWNPSTKIVRIGLQGKEYKDDELPASNLTFLIDVSGSMNSSNKLPLLKSAFKLLVNQLREKDKVSIVVYAGAAGLVLAPTSGAQKEKILAALNNLQAGGSTAGGEGIELAYKLAQKHFKKNGNNRVILATDGDFNVGASSDKAMEELIEEKRKSGVFLSVLGFGMGNYKDSKLETLADKGNGNHTYIDSMQEAQKVFGKEFGGTLYTIAKDVKIQVEFNPKQVQAYRLIGYENRLLADEDFVDDTKDAGELGSGHKVTALYEIIPAGIESAFLKKEIDLKYTDQQLNANYSDELLTVKFRYKRPDGDTSIEIVKVLNDTGSEMSENFQFVASVALFGMQLRNSSFTNNTTIHDVIRLAEFGKGNDNNGYRAEFIRLVKTYGNSL